MRIAVTGGNGDMGRSLIPYLLEQGHAVVSLDLALPATRPSANGRQADYVIADACDFGELVSAVRGCEALIHLAAIRSPLHHPDTTVYSVNTLSNYNALAAAAALGIRRVCLASSINAIGGAYSRAPRYDYFPVDEQHPTYAEDAYSLSKWVGEQQGDAFARRYENMSIASLRFHGLVETRKAATSEEAVLNHWAIRHLWAYTLLSAASRACLLSLTADFTGHEVFYIVAPTTTTTEPSLALAQKFYPNTRICGDFSGNKSFFNCAKAERLLGWQHEA